MKTLAARAIAQTRRALSGARSTHEQTIALELLYERGIGVGLSTAMKAFNKIKGLKLIREVKK